MYHNSTRVMAALVSLLAVSLLHVSACAKEIQLEPEAEFCFSADDFSANEQHDGIFLTSVPKHTIANVFYGDRVLRAGDALPVDALDQLTLISNCSTQQNTAIGYYTVSNGTIGSQNITEISILPKKNEPPEADDSELETYRNIANSGTLDAEDPEGGPLTYQIVTNPKRGSVELHEDGTFTYTPDKDKVGKDRFTFTVTDDAGQTSEPAEVEIEILKPSDKQVYADMNGQDGEFEAVWMKETGLFTGSTISSIHCFSPDATVSRGEFLVMAMNLVGADAPAEELRSGFSDEEATPVWMQPYIVSALGNGMISGEQSEAGMVFRPEAALTTAEAAVMLQNILQLPDSVQAVGSFDQNTAFPVWAETAVSALSSAGIYVKADTGDEIMTRLSAAKVLYQVNQLLQDEARSTFYWAK